MSGTVLHLRAETKELERRSALSPSTTKSLLDAGYEVHVERSKLRIFDDEEFAKVGASIVEEGSWPSAPTDHIIVGLKELEEEEFPLKHTHVQFAHCYKQQGGWDKVLRRFPAGGGTLLDLEFLTDSAGRRVAAFGYHAGFAGAALAVEAWAWQLEHGKKPMPSIHPFENEQALIYRIKSSLTKGRKIAGRLPRGFVMGALGRCGRGAVDLMEKIGIPSDHILKWDINETRDRHGPYEEIVESDIFVNCIYLSEKIPPFIDQKSLSRAGRHLSVVADVSCDTTNPHNPIPIYSINTTFTSPSVPVDLPSDPPLSVISIDHLPTLLPREASEAFSANLLPSLLQLKDRHTAPVWKGAEDLFKQKVGTLPEKQANGHA